jgi:probable F420-dependent oxidoreductase
VSRFGVLLPHFGPHASRDTVVREAVRLEELGFDSVWARDHVVYEPHEYEHPDPTFLDPIVVLSGVAAVTSRIGIGTGTLIPHRHPVAAALALSSLDALAGPGRLTVGIGLGSFGHEFDAVGMNGWDRREVVEEQVGIFRRLWTGEQITHHGRFYDFRDVAISPVPEARDLPIWYSGTSRAAVRRAVEYGDGWLPGSLPRAEYRDRRQRMEALANQAGRATPESGLIPFVSPGRTVEDAVAAVPMDAILAMANKRYRRPEGFSTLEDLDGTLMAGPPERLVEEIRRYEELGSSTFVLDLRFRFDNWRECTELLASEVLPRVRSQG